MSEVRANYDKSWKEALNEYFEDFLAFFFPEAHRAIDWTQTPELLDKELHAYYGFSRNGRWSG
ncbi:hypothetical protein NUACC21_38150 [Scytonema sp. NUACC21]